MVAAGAILRLVLAAALVFAPALALACTPFIEVHASGSSATLRPHATAFERCTVDESTYQRVVSEWLRSRPVGVSSLSLGRAVAYPWLSLHVADSALGSPDWASRVSRAKAGERDKLAAEMFRDPALLRRLAVPFEGSPYVATRVSFEKILFGKAEEHSSNRGGGSVMVPFDAQLWLRLDVRN